MIRKVLPKALGGYRANQSTTPLLLSERQTFRLLRVERQRADRRHIPFCLIEIALDPSNHGRKHITSLAKLLHKRLRATDEKGHLSPVTIGVLLTDTPEMGGRTVLADLDMLLQLNGFKAEMELRVYDPEAWDNDKRSRDRDEQDIAPPRTLDPPARNPRGIRAFAKRTVDLVGSSFGLMFASLPLAMACVAIRVTSAGPVFFCQKREGAGGKPFTIYKLRTMRVDAEAQQEDLLSRSERDGPAFKMKNDPRITPVGHFLRKTCIDELPQLMNVFLGQMSLVGPRPLPVGESRQVKPWQRRRLDVKPGITGPWQVAKHEAIAFDDWMRMDLAYIDSRSIAGDFRLIAKTALVPIKARGNH